MLWSGDRFGSRGHKTLDLHHLLDLGGGNGCTVSMKGQAQQGYEPYHLRPLYVNTLQNHMLQATACVHTVKSFKGTVSLAELANYCVLQAVMRGDRGGVRTRGREVYT